MTKDYVIYSRIQNKNRNTTNYELSPERAYKCAGKKKMNPEKTDTGSKVVTCSWFLTLKRFCQWRGKKYLFKKKERG